MRGREGGEGERWRERGRGGGEGGEREGGGKEGEKREGRCSKREGHRGQVTGVGQEAHRWVTHTQLLLESHGLHLVASTI